MRIYVTSSEGLISEFDLSKASDLEHALLRQSVLEHFGDLSLFAAFGGEKWRGEPSEELDA